MAVSRPHSGHRHRPDDVLQAGDAGALERDGRKALRPAIGVDAGLDAFEERPKCNHESAKVREGHEEEGEIFFVPFVDLRGFVVPAGF